MRTTKLARVGNSTGLTLSRDVLVAANLDRGDEVTVSVCDDRIGIARADDSYNKAMDVGRFAHRSRWNDGCGAQFCDGIHDGIGVIEPFPFKWNRLQVCVTRPVPGPLRRRAG